uniref:Uncharacterized protein n=1 Tax=Heterorhabditis bacteriophora TaxID=37862 RepID=A0A1I7WVU4_HETBA
MVALNQDVIISKEDAHTSSGIEEKSELTIEQSDNEEEKSGMQRELEELKGLVPDMQLKVDDAQASHEQIIKAKEVLKEALGGAFSALTNDKPVNDITGIVSLLPFTMFLFFETTEILQMRKSSKRSADPSVEDQCEESIKRPRPEE